MSDNIDQQFQQANQAAEQAIALSGAGANLESELRKAVTDRFQNSNISRQQAEARQGFLGAGTQARADIADLVGGGTILNPSQQQQIISERRASAAIPLETSANLMSLLTGGIQGAIGSGLRGFQTQVDAAGQRANLLRQSAQDAFSRSIQQAQLQMQQRKAQLDEMLSRANLSLKQQQASADPLDERVSLEQSAKFGLPVGTTLRDLLGQQLTEAGAEEDDTRVQTIAGLNALLQQGQETGFFNLGERSQFGNQKKILGQEIARIFESGRLSDQDRAFYQDLLPGVNEFRLRPNVARSKIEGIKFALQVNAGGVSGESPILADPETGQRFQYDSISDPDYKSDIGKGFFPQF